ncbi:queuosine biosynthesis domain protein [Leptospira interrogans serovar Pyrogenes str. L0374]|uniref:Queuosine biosynthesis domain protein n=3 Tax=Leptospira interrogans TaxID=173 RepID=M6K7L8_LEPIR|nr:queuosine biosynthesis domain protein [Leptospira interrogans serovar Lora str. TE 1992]EMM80842.1 queuosine biosynthesis domain protein [Leptospira interrogans str. 2006001854]EMN30154.1 queuosine biosynthesis domain protein [Leptospira interrogans serovar Pyrogenes str. L0374]EMN69272.1 queuosine biosynthesis domain protein [Leptospira interrogans serovar Bataviae str. UI 08561]
MSEERIARYPVANRDESRLMVLDVNTGTISSEPSFKNVISYLKEGDLLVANHTKVSKRRVYLRSKTKARIHEAMFLEEKESLWKCKIRNSKKLKMGEQLCDEKTKQILFTIERKEEEFVFLKPKHSLQEEDFQQIGEIPIPPYLKRNADSEDEIRYQTLFAKTPGSVAAPTAGLHFSENIFKTLKEKKYNSAL